MFYFCSSSPFTLSNLLLFTSVLKYFLIFTFFLCILLIFPSLPFSFSYLTSFLHSPSFQYFVCLSPLIFILSFPSTILSSSFLLPCLSFHLFPSFSLFTAIIFSFISLLYPSFSSSGSPSFSVILNVLSFPPSFLF